MCFYNDYDWFAEVNEATEGPAAAATKCDECGANIALGEWRKHVHQQEHECCQICEDGESSEYVAAGHYDDAVYAAQLLEGHACNYGEICEYDRCEACDKVIRAVIAHEKRAGCPANSQRPNLFTLWEELHEHDDAPIYIAEAVTAYPELWNHRPVFRMLDYYTEA